MYSVLRSQYTHTYTHTLYTCIDTHIYKIKIVAKLTIIVTSHCIHSFVIFHSFPYSPSIKIKFCIFLKTFWDSDLAGIAVKLLLSMPASHVRVFTEASASAFFIQHPANAHFWKHQVIANLLRSLPGCERPELSSKILVLVLFQGSMLWAFGQWTRRQKCLLFCLSCKMKMQTII